MIIDIKGFDFSNKGALLMLLTTLKGLNGPNVQFASKPRIGPYQLRAERGLLQLLSTDRFGGALNEALKVAPNSLRREYGIVLHDEIDAVVDISGFALGDYWGAKYPLRLAQKCKRWKKKGKKVIFLPQAFGPFSGASIKSAMAEIIEYADRIYARDSDSFAYLLECVDGKNDGTIVSCPDMTIGYSVSRNATDRQNLVGIAPNVRVFKGHSAQLERDYIAFLADAVAKIRSQGKEAELIIHDDSDSEVADAVQARIAEPISIVTIPDAVELKRHLGSYAYIIASRYHALVAALSQNVPAIALGWSHKYNRLLEEYGLGEWSFNVAEDPSCLSSAGSLIERWDHFLDPTKIQYLQSQNTQFKQNIGLMWDDVRSLLGIEKGEKTST